MKSIQRVSLMSAVCFVSLFAIAAVLLAGFGHSDRVDDSSNQSMTLSANAMARVGGNIQVSPPFDVGAIIRQVHFAYRQDSETGHYIGGGDSFGVRVATDGSFAFTPYRLEETIDFEAEFGERPEDPLEREEWKRARMEHRPVAIEGMSATFSTSFVGRGGSEFTPLAGAPVTAAGGGLAIERTGTVERLKNSETGVEQSWHFDEYPDGWGDLTVRVEVNGLPFVDETESGLHFADDSDIGLRYSHATWIDATGAETQIPVLWTGSEIVLTVPEAVIDASVFPATLDPTISPEFGVTDESWVEEWEEGVWTAAGRPPSIAFDGTNYLIVWCDDRNSATTQEDIFGARVDQSGNLLDESGFEICTAITNQQKTAVAFDGTNYLVVWEDERNYLTTVRDIYGARVDTSGTVLDPSGIAIGVASDGQYVPDVSFDGTNYLVVWYDARDYSTNSFDVYGTRVTTSGSVLDPSGFAISASANGESFPAVASDGTNSLVVWEDGGYGTKDIYGTRVSTSGTVLDPSGIAISTATDNQYGQDVAFDGTNYMVVWHDIRDGFDMVIYGSRISTGGAVLDPSGIAISTDDVYDDSNPTIAFDGTNYFVAWTSSSDIYGSRVDTTGTVLDPSGIGICFADSTQGSPAVVSSGTGFFVVWLDHRNAGGPGIYGSRITAGGAVLDPLGLIVGGREVVTQQYTHPYFNQNDPAVAFDGTNFLVVWTDDRNSETTDDDIYGARVSPTGEMLDEFGIEISAEINDQTNPVVAFGGTDYLVVWEDLRNDMYRDLYMARVSQAGEVLDPDGIALNTATNNQTAPAIAFDGTNYMVVWGDGRGTYYAIYGARVNQSGVVLSPSEIGISVLPTHLMSPAIAFDGTNYMVAWKEGTTGSNILGARVTTGGTVLDPVAIAISSAPGADGPAVASCGSNSLVVWRDYYQASTADILGARVAPDGSLLDPSGIAIATSANQETSPAVAYDGANYLVAWAGDFDIYGTWVTPEGLVLEPDGVAFSNDPETENYPVIAPAGTGRSLVVYEAYEPATEKTRAMARTITWGVNGIDCEQDSDCISEFCVDGVCCDTECGGGVEDEWACNLAGSEGTCTEILTCYISQMWEEN